MTARLLFYLAFVPSAAAPVVEGRKPAKYAVLVGVNDYDSPKLPAIKYAEADAVDLSKTLGKAGYEVTLLIGKKATGAAVAKELTGVAKKAEKGDLVLVALAGHGLQFEGDGPHFCPVDAKPTKEDARTRLAIDEIVSGMDKSFATNKLFLIDASRNDPSATRDAKCGRFAGPPAGTAILFSCKAGERAYEVDKYRHGVFFHHVLEVLAGQHPEAVNNRGEIVWDLFQLAVRERVSADVPHVIGGGARQTPHLLADLTAVPVLVEVKSER